MLGNSLTPASVPPTIRLLFLKKKEYPSQFLKYYYSNFISICSQLTCFLRPQSHPFTAYSSQRNVPPALCGGDSKAVKFSKGMFRYWENLIHKNLCFTYDKSL